MSHTPQNADEAGYVSFALIDALVDLLINKGIITPQDCIIHPRNGGEAPPGSAK